VARGRAPTPLPLAQDSDLALPLTSDASRAYRVDSYNQLRRQRLGPHADENTDLYGGLYPPMGMWYNDKVKQYKLARLLRIASLYNRTPKMGYVGRSELFPERTQLDDEIDAYEIYASSHSRSLDAYFDAMMPTDRASASVPFELLCKETFLTHNLDLKCYEPVCWDDHESSSDSEAEFKDFDYECEKLAAVVDEIYCIENDDEKNIHVDSTKGVVA
jgi:hypothetical protein